MFEGVDFSVTYLRRRKRRGKERKCGSSSYSVETELAKSSTVGWLSFCKGGQISFCEIIGGSGVRISPPPFFKTTPIFHLGSAS